MHKNTIEHVTKSAETFDPPKNTYPIRKRYDLYVQKVVKPRPEAVGSIEELEKVYQKLIGMARSCKSICYPSYYGKYIANDNKVKYLQLLRESHTVHMVASCVSDFSV